MTEEERVTLRDYIDQRLVDSDKAIQAALASAERAVIKAESASERRFESVNEFRASLADQQRLFLTRSEYDANHKNLGDRIDKLETFRSEYAGRDKGNERYTATILAILSIVISLVLVVISVFEHATGGK